MSKHATSSAQRFEWLVVATGATTGLSIWGDSLLYNVLPLEATHLGISLPLVGVLLSANRLVRLICNTPISALFERLGPGRPFVAATVLALVTTILYGAGWGFLVFLLARVGWGIAWSALRQAGYQAIWMNDERVRGRLMGTWGGIVRLGSALSVLVGGYLRDQWGYRFGISAAAIAAVLAIPIALSIRWPQPVSQARPQSEPLLRGWWTALRHRQRRWIVIAGFLNLVVEGILVSTASLFLKDRLGTQDPITAFGFGVGTATGVLLAVRWLSELVFGPLFGALSDYLGQARTAVLLSLLLLVSLAGAVVAPGLYPLLYLSLAFVTRAGLVATLGTAATTLAARSERPHLFVGIFATAIDAGSATGPLLAYSLATITDLGHLYLLGSAALLLVVVRYWWTTYRA